MPWPHEAGGGEPAARLRRAGERKRDVFDEGPELGLTVGRHPAGRPPREVGVLKGGRELLGDGFDAGSSDSQASAEALDAVVGGDDFDDLRVVGAEYSDIHRESVLPGCGR